MVGLSNKKYGSRGFRNLLKAGLFATSGLVAESSLAQSPVNYSTQRDSIQNVLNQNSTLISEKKDLVDSLELRSKAILEELGRKKTYTAFTKEEKEEGLLVANALTNAKSDLNNLYKKAHNDSLSLQSIPVGNVLARQKLFDYIVGEIGEAKVDTFVSQRLLGDDYWIENLDSNNLSDGYKIRVTSPNFGPKKDRYNAKELQQTGDVMGILNTFQDVIPNEIQVELIHNYLVENLKNSSDSAKIDKSKIRIDSDAIYYDGSNRNLIRKGVVSGKGKNRKGRVQIFNQDIIAGKIDPSYSNLSLEIPFEIMGIKFIQQYKKDLLEGIDLKSMWGLGLKPMNISPLVPSRTPLEDYDLITAKDYLLEQLDTLNTQVSTLRDFERSYSKLSDLVGDRTTFRDDDVELINNELGNLRSLSQKLNANPLYAGIARKAESLEDSLLQLGTSYEGVIQREENAAAITNTQAQIEAYKNTLSGIKSIEINPTIAKFGLEGELTIPKVGLSMEEQYFDSLTQNVLNFNDKYRNYLGEDTLHSEIWTPYSVFLQGAKAKSELRLNELEALNGLTNQNDIDNTEEAIRRFIRTVDETLGSPLKIEDEILETMAESADTTKSDMVSDTIVVEKPLLVYQKGFFFEPHMTTNFKGDNRVGAGVGYDFGHFSLSIGGDFGYGKEHSEIKSLSEPNEDGLQYGNQIKTDVVSNRATVRAMIGTSLSRKLSLSAGPLAEIKSEYKTENVQEQIYRDGKIIRAGQGYQVRNNDMDVKYGVGISGDLSLTDKFGAVAGVDFIRKDARFKLGVRLGGR